MVTIVRKRKPKGYFRGGAVIPDNPLDLARMAAPAEAPPEPIDFDIELEKAPEPEAPRIAPINDNPLAEAARATERAQRLNNPQTVGDLIDALPDHSEHKKQFLRQNPDVLFDQFKAQSMARHYREAIEAGIADDTPEIDDYILSGIREDIAARQVSHGRAGLDAMMSPPQTPEDMTRHSVTHNRRAESVQQAYEAAPHVAAQSVETAPVATEPARRHIPVSAPPSRDVPSPMSGSRGAQSKITLSVAEQEMAKLSYHWLSEKDALIEYARQKKRLAEMRANGEYPERERN